MSDAMPRISKTVITGTCRTCRATVKADIHDDGVVERMAIHPFPCSCGSPEDEFGPMIDSYDWNWQPSSGCNVPRAEGVELALRC